MRGVPEYPFPWPSLLLTYAIVLGGSMLVAHALRYRFVILAILVGMCAAVGCLFIIHLWTPSGGDGWRRLVNPSHPEGYAHDWIGLIRIAHHVLLWWVAPMYVASVLIRWRQKMYKRRMIEAARSY